ncbi:MAG: hypothetical protein ACKKL4_00795 [Patescibacteria group bacterium]
MYTNNMFTKINPFNKKGDQDAQDQSKPVSTDKQKSEKKGFFAGIKDKATLRILEKQLAGVPEAQREMLTRAIQNNPEFFEKLAGKIKEEEKRNGGNQMAASMKVMREHQNELVKIISGR